MKKILGILLSAALILTMIPFSSIAAGEIATVQPEGKTAIACTSVSAVNDAIFNNETSAIGKSVNVTINENYIGDITFKNDKSKITLKNGVTYTGVVKTPGSLDAVFENVKAVIDKTYYTTLKASFDSAKKLGKDTEIKLYADNANSDSLADAIGGGTDSFKSITLDVNGKKCYEGSTTKENALNNISRITLKGAVAWYDGYLYPKLSDAVNAADTKNDSNNKTVYLINNVTEDVSEPTNSVVIDLNGKEWNGMKKIPEDSNLSVTDPKYWPVYIGVKDSGTEKYYSSISEAILKAKNSGDTITLQKNITEDVNIYANKNIVLDLAGCTINGDVRTYGYLLIKDSTNTLVGDNVTIGSGTINGKLYLNYGTIVVQSGVIDLNNGKGEGLSNEGIFDDSTRLDTGSTYYKIDDKYVVLHNGNLQISLVYKLFEKDGTTPVLSLDSDDTPDIVKGQEYVMKIYFKSNSNNIIKIRGFDFTSVCNYDSTKITIENSYSGENKYDTVTRKDNIIEGDGIVNKSTSFHYIMAQNGFTVNEKTVDPMFLVAQYNLKVNDSAVIGDLINFGFAESPASISVEGLTVKIPIYQKDEYVANVVSSTDGVNVVDYQYAPEGYKLAVISRDIPKGSTLKHNGEKLYCTTSKDYAELSKDVNAEKVYLLFFNLNDIKNTLVASDPSNPTYAEMAVAIGKCVETVKLKSGEKENMLYYLPYSDSDLNNMGENDYFDIYDDGVIDFNDASIVYQMIRSGGETWGYDSNNVSKYLGAKSRFLADSDGDGKAYGTIEDIDNIIKNYSKNGNTNHVITNAKAYVNGNYYSTLNEAFNSVKNSGSDSEILLYDNNVSTDSLKAILGSDTGTYNGITINLNGKICYEGSDTIDNALKIINKVSLIGAVAWYDGKLYPTLSGAVSAADNSGISGAETVYLINNVTENVPEPGNKVIINLNGKKWNGTDELSKDSNISIVDLDHWLVYIQNIGTGTKKYYNSVSEAVLDANTGEIITLNKAVTEDVNIYLNKNVVLDLAGNTLTGDIKIYGTLLIKDSTNTIDGDDITIGTGTVKGKIYDYGTVVVQSGIIDLNKGNGEEYSNEGIFDDSTHLSLGSTYYLVNDKYIVLKNGNLQIDLEYKLYESDGITPVLSTNGDSRPDVVKGRQYVMKLYFKSNSTNNINIKGFDFTSFCDYDNTKITVDSSYSIENKYDTVTRKDSVITGNLTANMKSSFHYLMDQKVITVQKKSINPMLLIAQYRVTVNSNAKVGDTIKFGFTESPASISVVGQTIDIPINNKDNYYVDVISAE